MNAVSLPFSGIAARALRVNRHKTAAFACKVPNVF